MNDRRTTLSEIVFSVKRLWLIFAHRKWNKCSKHFGFCHKMHCSERVCVTHADRDKCAVCCASCWWPMLVSLAHQVMSLNGKRFSSVLVLWNWLPVCDNCDARRNHIRRIELLNKMLSYGVCRIANLWSRVCERTHTLICFSLLSPLNAMHLKSLDTQSASLFCIQV